MALMFRIILLLMIGCCRLAGAETAPLRLYLQWRPQAQFAGYYLAEELGFYREAGLQLELHHLAAHRTPVQLLADGKADFVSDWLPSAVSRRAAGVPVVSVGQLMRRSGMLLVGSKVRGVETLADLAGRRVGVWVNDFRLGPLCMLLREKIAFETVPSSGDIELFLWGGCDAMAAMIYSEYFSLLNAGLEPEDLSVFCLDDYGVPLPGDGIYALEETCRQRPDECRALVEATRRGWEAAFADPEKALEAVRRACRQGDVYYNEAEQRWMLEHLKALYDPPGAAARSQLSREEYEFVGQMLRDNGFITGPLPDFAEFAPLAAGAGERE